MNDRISSLLNQMTALEEELSAALQEHETRVSFIIKGKRIEFEQSVKEAHRKLKTGFIRWLVTDRPQNLITGPIIYAMIFPLLIADLTVSFYQLTCFPIYRIAKVHRADYIVFDRQHLQYLNFFEKFHCTYCAYGTGLIAYISEIIARTEQYFCPIKHARKVIGVNSCYARYLNYGETENYAARVEGFRKELASRKNN